MDRMADETQQTTPLERLVGGEWFYTQRGQTYGPVTLSELRAAAHLGFLGPDDLVRRNNHDTWATARSMPGLFN